MKSSRLLGACLLVAEMHCVGDSTSTTDGGTDAASATDVTVADVVDAGSETSAPACNAALPFAVQAIAELNTANADQGARLTHDELTIYFEVAPGSVGGTDLVTATRASSTAKWSAPTALIGTGVDTASGEFEPTVSLDDETLIFDSDRDGGVGVGDFYIATRASTQGAWSNVTNVAGLNSSADEGYAYLMPDALTVYFASLRSGNWELYRAKRASISTAFVVDATSHDLDVLNQSTSAEQWPVVTADERTIYFASNRTGGKGDYDVWTATRSSSTDPFPTPTLVTELNTAGHDAPTWVSDDGCRLYLTTQNASLDLAVAVKPAQ